MKEKTKDRLLNIILWLSLLLIGYIAGNEMAYRSIRKQTAKLEYVLRLANANANNKVSTLLTAMENMYVDSVNVDSIVEVVLKDILSKLDPHSAYYPAEETKESNDELHGSFSGIGVQFSIQDDTIHINSVIKGGPSEKVGLMAGDRIVYIDDSLFAGQKIVSNDAVKNLKGPQGSEVKVGVLRPGNPEILDFVIVRGPIPVKSVDAAYMVDDEVGYIELNKFGETSYQEFTLALASLEKQGMKKLIVDLRGNTGGYLGVAIMIVNEFLPKGQKIVYTEGLHSKYSAEYANGRGRYQSIPLVVLIDESSASASEIFTGAIQDNDRGMVVGRRSFGKGLVQQPIDFRDGSSVRLTIARYYTPSGRCIQKPYGDDDEDYDMDLLKRYERGEFFSADSVKLDESQIFTTTGGRTVYGGGGIMPDYFVPQDTIAPNDYYSKIVRSSLVNLYALKYVDTNRQKLSVYAEYEKLLEYLETQDAFGAFVKFAADKDVKGYSSVSQEVSQYLHRLVYSALIYNALDMQEYVRYINSFDSTMLKAVDVLSD